MIVAGVDIGSTMTKVIVLNRDREILSQGLEYTGAMPVRASERALEDALSRAGAELGDLKFVVGTGYGRRLIPFGDAQVTEISCHARGIIHFEPQVRTLLDIGGQDTKGIQVDAKGNVVNFVMNDKCAAGTGRFLEVMARVLEVDLNDVGDLSLKSTERVSISSTCTVFAESEVISHISGGKKVEDILAGIHDAIATRAVGLIRRTGVAGMVAMTGGVSKNKGMVKALTEILGRPIFVSPDAQFAGALGAALIAADRVALPAGA